MVVNGLRPSNFTGFNNVTSGEEFNISATDWNDFIDKLNEFSEYKSLSSEMSAMTTVSSGQSFKATYFNQIINNMNVLSDYINSAYPTTKSAGNKIYALYFTQLKNALNSIE
jgi:hypothetical protein